MFRSVDPRTSQCACQHSLVTCWSVATFQQRWWISLHRTARAGSTWTPSRTRTSWGRPSNLRAAAWKWCPSNLPRTGEIRKKANFPIGFGIFFGKENQFSHLFLCIVFCALNSSLSSWMVKLWFRTQKCDLHRGSIRGKCRTWRISNTFTYCRFTADVPSSKVMIPSYKLFYGTHYLTFVLSS